MIEIKCTLEQKEKIIESIVKHEGFCVCEGKDDNYRCNDYNSCESCIRDNIKWMLDSEA